MLRRVYIILYISVVLVIEEGVGDDRQGTAISGFTPEDIPLIVNTHNEFRRQRNSSNMRLMTWNTDLEGVAQGWVDSCIFGHNPDTKNRFGFSNIGENFFISQADTYEAEESVEHWHEEIYDYTYDNLTCNPGRVCGHYTQVVWADSYDVGCGIKWCTNISNSFPGFEEGLLIVCNYGPAGNWPDAKPYEFGAACTQCPAEAQVCSGGLCAISEQTTTSTTTTPLTTTTSTTTTPTTTTSTTTTLSTTTSTTTTPSTTTSTTTTPSTTTSTTRTPSTTTSTTTTPSTTTSTPSTTSSTQTSTPRASSSSASPSPSTETKTDVSSDTLDTQSTTTVATGGITTIGPKTALDMETEIIQTFVIFAFVAASVSVCFIFNTLRTRFNRKDEEKTKLNSL